MLRVSHWWTVGLLLISALAPASDDNGEIAGRVVDVAGAALPSARVQLFRSDLRIRWERYTDPSGEFSATGLPPGSFSIVISLQGFRDRFIPEVRIVAGQPLNLGMLRLDFGPCNTPGGPICDSVQAVKGAAEASVQPIPAQIDGIPVFTVCEVLADAAQYDGKLVIVVGRSTGTFEGSWLAEDCSATMLINGWPWEPSISTTYVVSKVAPPPQLPAGFKWDRKLLRQKLEQVQKTTKLRVSPQSRYKGRWIAAFGRIETQSSASGAGR